MQTIFDKNATENFRKISNKHVSFIKSYYRRKNSIKLKIAIYPEKQ